MSRIVAPSEWPLSRDHNPSPDELSRAHREFEVIEPRGLFYHVATELVDLAIRGQTSVTLVEAIAVLLQTWNRSFYQYHRKFDAQHFTDLEDLLHHHHHALMRFRQRSIERLTHQDEDVVQYLFANFEGVLGPVGAAKCLHLLAPHFFPLWDRAIATGYGLSMGEMGENAERYVRFMRITQRQCRALAGRLPAGVNPLKALDEYNYCVFTKDRDLAGGRS